MNKQARSALCGLKSSAAILALSLTWMSSAHAQQAEISDTPAASPNEIIVTAQRRAESVQDVPISVQAVTGDTLVKTGISDTSGLAQITPTLNFTGGTLTAHVSLTLRGVSSASTSPGVQSSTSLVVDGVPLVRQGEFMTELADIERVEILNGPQGTLFGKNSTAGVVNVVTKRPTHDFEAWGEAGATTDKEYSGKGMLNLPLGDTVAFRINGFYRHLDPLIKNISTFPSARDAGGTEAWGFEAKLLADLSDRTTLLLSGGYSFVNSSFGVILVDIPRNAAQAAILGYTPGTDRPVINQDTPSINEDKSWHIAGELNVELSDALQLTSISSYRSAKERNDGDNDVTGVGVIKGLGFTPNPTGYPIRRVSIGLDRHSDNAFYWSNETRINYDAGPVSAVAGFFYQHLRSTFRSTNPQVIDASFFGPAVAAQFPAGALLFSDTANDHKFIDKTASVFGDVTYKVTPTVSLFGGLRYTHEVLDIDYSIANYRNNITGFFDPITAVNTAPPTSTNAFLADRTVNNLSGRAGVKWEPSNAINLYASYAHGYKGPAADLSRTAQRTAATVPPEIADAFEVGAKLRLLDRRLALNVAAFTETIKDIQATKTVPGPPVQTALTTAGDLRTRGVESDFSFAITPEFTLSGGAAYVDAEYRNFCGNTYAGETGFTPCPLAAGVTGQVLDGSQARGSPKFKWSLTAAYNRELASGASFFVQAGYTHTSSIIYSIDANPLAREPGYGSLNASAGFTTADKHWDFQIYGKNLTDEFYYVNILNIPSTIGVRVGQVGRDYKPYGGVKVRYHF